MGKANPNGLRVRVGRNETDIAKLTEDFGKLEERLREVENQQSKISERITLYQFGQGALALILSTIAALVGRSQ